MLTFRSCVAVLVLLASMPYVYAQTDGVTVDEPWIRAAPPTAKALAGYMTIRNHGPEQSLIGAESNAFQNVMLHQTVTRDGMASMIHRQNIKLPRGVELFFEPNGYHLMLIKPKQPLRPGDKVTIDLLFGNGFSQPVEFTVRKGGAAEGHTRSRE